jgi:hypothetical protein
MPFCHDCPDRPRKGQIYANTKCAHCRPTDDRHDFKTHVSIDEAPPGETAVNPSDSAEWRTMINEGESMHEHMVGELTEFFRAWLVLPSNVRDIVARRFAGDSLQRIADAQGISAQGVEWRQYRALRRVPILRWLFKIKQTKRERKLKHGGKTSGGGSQADNKPTGG